MTHVQMTMGGSGVDLMSRNAALTRILSACSTGEGTPLAVASANLDHIHHFGRGARWAGVLEQSQKAGRVSWLTLLDGQPLVRQAARVTGKEWPKLSGSDLIFELLDEAQAQGVVVGFLGGSAECRTHLEQVVSERWPRLTIGGFWTPDRGDVVDRQRSELLALQVRESGTQLLFVGLGKPRQEVWITEYGHLTGARALLAFGASADFVAGTATRAPEWVSSGGMEWLWRLSREPKRLAQRYLIEGPHAYAAIRQQQQPSQRAERDSELPRLSSRPFPSRPRSGPVTDEAANVTALIVTYNSADTVAPLVRDLSMQVGGLSVRTIVIDNGSQDATCEVARAAGAEVIEAPGNLGYAGGINVGLAAVGDTDAVFVLNPDVTLAPTALKSMWDRLQQPGVGAVVPTILDSAGEPYPSLRFEPSLLRGVGDALLGARMPGRPHWLAETDAHPESYQYPHAVEWATGAALLISWTTVKRVGDWSEDYFLYSEEVDYMRRIRAAGLSVWFEPSARVTHAGQGSGSSPELDALMSVNRVRYAEAHHGRRYARAVRLTVTLGEALRVSRGPGHRRSLHYLLSKRRWSKLPGPRLHMEPAPAMTAARSVA